MRRGLVVALLTVALVVAAAPAANADFGFEPGSVQATSLEAGGQPETQAGAHPDTLNIGFRFTRTAEGSVEANVRDLTVDLPAGYGGDPSATPLCTRAQIVLATCPPETQVGTAAIEFAPSGEEAPVPIYNVVPEQGVTAEFAMFMFLFPVRLDASVRPEDLGTRVKMSDILQEFPLDGAQITLWGVPADHQTGTSIPRRPLLTLPTRCDVPLITNLSVRTWEQPNATLTASASSEPLSGCSRLAVSPTAAVVPDATATGTPTGPQSSAPSVPAERGSRPRGELASRVTPFGGTARKPGLRVSLRRSGAAKLRSVAVTLPRVLGLDVRAVPQLCSREEARDDRCPAAARIGSASLITPLAPERMSAPLYAVAAPRGGPPDLWTSLTGDGVRVVLDGATTVRRNGQIASRFAIRPGVPLTALELRLRGGARGLLAVDSLRCRRPRAQRTSAHVAVRSQGGVAASQTLATGPWGRCTQGR
jgi:hypothetical protein